MKTILAPIDFSEVAAGVLDSAATLAPALDARIVLLHVLAPSVIMTAYGIPGEALNSPLQQEEEKRAREVLERYGTLLRQRGIEVLTEVREGRTTEAILQSAEEHGANFVVIGSHGHGAVYDLLVGSTARGILREAGCPILVVPHRVRAGAIVPGA